jgi:dTDP-glucose 4,6-dehydratase
VSTDEVYGSLGPEDARFTESTPYSPNSPYSVSKAASDHLVHAYHHAYGLATTISNRSNMYWPHQFAGKLIPVRIGQLLAGKSLPVYGDGRNIRDWLHIKDRCRGLEAVLESRTVGAVYDIGGRSECENVHLVRTQRGASNVRQRSTGHDRRYAIDCSRIEHGCEYLPRIRLDDGLRLTLACYLQHPDALVGWQRTAV